jgi:hypothetical protein
MSEKPLPWGALFDTRGEFFRPLWIRILVVAFAAGWAGFELWRGETFWATIFAAFAGVGFYGFFIDPKRAAAQPKPDE